MNVIKKTAILFGVICLAIIIFAWLFVRPFFGEASLFYPIAPNHYVEDYVKEYHGIEVNVVEKHKTEDGYRDFTVSPVENKEMQFTVSVYENLFIFVHFYADYETALYEYEEHPKLKSILPDIEKLGFKAEVHEDMELPSISTGSDLYLDTVTPFNIKTFIKNDGDTYYTLYELIHNSKLNIEGVWVSNPPVNVDYYESVSFRIGDHSKLKSKNEFLLDMKKENPDLIVGEEEVRLEKELKALSNERFKLGNEYEATPDNPHASWLDCMEVNEKGKCTNANLNFEIQKNSFTSSNTHLKEDITAIIDFIDNHLEPEIKIELIDFQMDNNYDEMVWITIEEREQYPNIDELIEFITSRDE